jgi:transposase
VKTGQGLAKKTRPNRRHSAPGRPSNSSEIELRLALEAAEQKIGLQTAQVKELVEENRKLSSARWATEQFLQNEIRKLNLKITKLESKLETANKQLAWFRKNKFGRSTEQTNQEPETTSDEKETGDSASSKRKRNRGQQSDAEGHGRSDRSEVDTNVEYIEIPGCACGKCGTPFRLLARTEASPLTEFEASVVRTVFQRCIYVSQCLCEGKQIRVAPPPAKLYPRTEIGNSLWLRLVVQKFLNGIPTNRILKDLSLYGLHLAAGTVTDGCKIINELLNPVMEELIKHCRGGDLWNADETSWRVFGEGKQRWWMWLIASDEAIVYLLDPSRSKKVPTDFFAGSAGILMTDRLASYKGLHEGIRKAWCLIHLRRDIFNIFKGIPQLKPWAEGWLRELATLFVLNHKRFELWQRDKNKGPEWDNAVLALEMHVRQLKDRWEKELKRPRLHEEQAKILRSMKRHWAGYTLFLEDPRIPLHNNRAERLLRNAVILRKNSYGSGAIWAGNFAAKLFSIIQTWLINGLDPQALLLDYFAECSKTPGKTPSDVSQFIPWQMSLTRKLKYALPESYQRPG